jgi:3-oxoacyl-[acyl-carrier protein] reductase
VAGDSRAHAATAGRIGYRGTGEEGLIDERFHEGRVAIVVGGAGALGQAVAGALSERGAGVALVDASPTVHDAAELLSRLGTGTSGHLADITDADSIEHAFAEVRERHGPAHMLLNCAGIAFRKDGRKVSAMDMTPEEWRRLIDVNLTGVFLSIRAALPMMRDLGWGRIVSISSQGGRTGGVFSSVDYGAAKAGVIGLSRTLAVEVGALGITVNCVAPGRVASEMTSYESERGQNAAWIESLPVRRMATPDEVAAAMVYLTSDAAAYITGATLDINGGGFMA